MHLPPQSEAIVRLHLGGNTVSEIAKDLAISQAAVWQRLRRARETMRERWLDAQKEVRAPIRTQSRQQAGPDVPVMDQPAEVASDPLAALPPRQRQVLTMAQTGKKPLQIAAELGITANAVRVNLHHARKAIAA